MILELFSLRNGLISWTKVHSEHISLFFILLWTPIIIFDINPSSDSTLCWTRWEKLHIQKITSDSNLHNVSILSGFYPWKDTCINILSKFSEVFFFFFHTFICLKNIYLNTGIPIYIPYVFSDFLKNFRDVIGSTIFKLWNSRVFYSKGWDNCIQKKHSIIMQKCSFCLICFFFLKLKICLLWL